MNETSQEIGPNEVARPEIDLEDDVMPVAVFNPSVGPSTVTPDADVMEQDSAMDQTEETRQDAVYLRGVDDLSTKDIANYANHYFPLGVCRIEWIDDTSVNLAYDNSELATQALIAFAQDSSIVNQWQLRPAKPCPEKEMIELSVRRSFVSDQKVKGARQRSRYYLLHGEPESQGNGRSLRRYSDSDRRYRQENRFDDEDLFPGLTRNRSRSRSPVRLNNGATTQDDTDLFPTVDLHPEAKQASTEGRLVSDTMHRRERPKSKPSLWDRIDQTERRRYRERDSRERDSRERRTRESDTRERSRSPARVTGDDFAKRLDLSQNRQKPSQNRSSRRRNQRASAMDYD